MATAAAQAAENGEIMRLGARERLPAPQDVAVHRHPLRIATKACCKPYPRRAAIYGIICQLRREIRMGTRNVVLTDRQEELIEQLVSQGRYQNASEVLRDGLRLIESREAEEKARLRALRDAARIGIEDIDAGRFRDFDSASELRQHLDSLARRTVGSDRSR
jgi:antitoxin ParD1/3/4